MMMMMIVRLHKSTRSQLFLQIHPASVVFDNYDCKYGGISEEHKLPFVTDIDVPSPASHFVCIRFFL